MGKLYKIKRAVRNNPDIWRNEWGHPQGAKYVKKDSWEVRYKREKPGWQPRRYWYERNSYKALVKHTLEEIGK